MLPIVVALVAGIATFMICTRLHASFLFLVIALCATLWLGFGAIANAPIPAVRRDLASDISAIFLCAGFGAVCALFKRFRD